MDKQVSDPFELVQMGIATIVELEQKEFKTTPPMGVRPGAPQPENHTHVAVVDENGMGETKADNTGHQHKVRNWVALYSGVGPHIHKVER